jgi:hypothetical protein
MINVILFQPYRGYFRNKRTTTGKQKRTPTITNLKQNKTKQETTKNTAKIYYKLYWQ